MSSLLQHRGSLHAHILLWVHPEDMPRVKQEITATRCKYKEVQAADGAITHTPDLPDDPVADRLYMLVERKQMHKCRDTKGGCKHERHDCRYGFPFAPNLQGTVFDERSKR